jgi:hypothetical protein
MEYYSAIKKNEILPGMMAHACNPNYWEAKIRRTLVQGQLRQKKLARCQDATSTNKVRH